MLAMHIKAESHDDTLILPINILAERLSDASREVGVKLLGYNAAPAAWHPRFVLPSVAADEGERGTNYDLPPGCPELPVILTEDLR